MESYQKISDDISHNKKKSKMKQDSFISAVKEKDDISDVLNKDDSLKPGKFITYADNSNTTIESIGIGYTPSNSPYCPSYTIRVIFRKYAPIPAELELKKYMKQLPHLKSDDIRGEHSSKSLISSIELEAPSDRRQEVAYFLDMLSSILEEVGAQGIDKKIRMRILVNLHIIYKPLHPVVVAPIYKEKNYQQVLTLCTAEKSTTDTAPIFKEENYQHALALCMPKRPGYDKEQHKCDMTLSWLAYFFYIHRKYNKAFECYKRVSSTDIQLYQKCRYQLGHIIYACTDVNKYSDCREHARDALQYFIEAGDYLGAKPLHQKLLKCLYFGFYENEAIPNLPFPEGKGMKYINAISDCFYNHQKELNTLKNRNNILEEEVKKLEELVQILKYEKRLTFFTPQQIDRQENALVLPDCSPRYLRK